MERCTVGGPDYFDGADNMADVTEGEIPVTNSILDDSNKCSSSASDTPFLNVGNNREIKNEFSIEIGLYYSQIGNIQSRINKMRIVYREEQKRQAINLYSKYVEYYKPTDAPYAFKRFRLSDHSGDMLSKPMPIAAVVNTNPNPTTAAVAGSPQYDMI